MAATKLAAGQCLVNALPDRVLQLRLDGEQDPDTYLVAHPIRGATVRRQRARRMVVPVSAQSQGDRRAWSPHISERVHGQDGIVSERHAHKLKRTAPSPAKAMAIGGFVLLALGLLDSLLFLLSVPVARLTTAFFIAAALLLWGAERRGEAVWRLHPRIPAWFLAVALFVAVTPVVSFL